MLVEKAGFPVKMMARVLGVSRSCFYSWLLNGCPEDGWSAERNAVMRVWLESDRRFVHTMLPPGFAHVTRYRVLKLMRELGIRGCTPPNARKRTTIPDPKPKPRPDLVRRDFTSSVPTYKLVGDITYLRTGEGWLYIIDPVEVLDFHNFLAASNLTLTDSGGIQEEAPSLGKPVLVMRDTTERPEGVAAGTLKLVGTDEDVIYREFSGLLSDKDEYGRMSWASNPYGDGHASERIADVLGRQACSFKRAHAADSSSRCLWVEKRIGIRF